MELMPQERRSTSSFVVVVKVGDLEIELFQRVVATVKPQTIR